MNYRDKQREGMNHDSGSILGGTESNTNVKLLQKRQSIVSREGFCNATVDASTSWLFSNVWEDQTHSVSLQSRKASSTALTRHSLQSRGALGTGVSGGTGVSLRESRIYSEERGGTDVFFA